MSISTGETTSVVGLLINKLYLQTMVEHRKASQIIEEQGMRTRGWKVLLIRLSNLSMRMIWSEIQKANISPTLRFINDEEHIFASNHESLTIKMKLHLFTRTVY